MVSHDNKQYDRYYYCAFVSRLQTFTWLQCLLLAPILVLGYHILAGPPSILRRIPLALAIPLVIPLSLAILLVIPAILVNSFLSVPFGYTAMLRLSPSFQ